MMLTLSSLSALAADDAGLEDHISGIYFSLVEWNSYKMQTGVSI